MRGCATEKKASQFYECADLLGKKETEREVNFVDYDSENSRTATAALTILEKEGIARRLSKQHISDGVKVRPSCRFEEIDIATSTTESVKVILDVAHNPQAFEYLFTKLRHNYPSTNLRIVVGFSADKDVKTLSDLLLENVSHPSKIHLVESSNPRAASISTVLESANPKLLECNYQQTSVSVQVKDALKLAATNDELLVICGSFFIMAEARAELGIEEPRDGGAIGEETARIIQRQSKK